MLTNGNISIEDFKNFGQFITKNELSEDLSTEEQYRFIKCEEIPNRTKYKIIEMFNYKFMSLMFSDNESFYKEYYECIINLCRYNTVKLDCKYIKFDEKDLDKLYDLLKG